MQFTNYWEQFEHTGKVEDYLNYLRDAVQNHNPENCRAMESTEAVAGEDGSCRNSCM